MINNALPNGASSNFEECARELEKGNVVRLFPTATTNADTEIPFAHQKLEPGYSGGVYEIEFITPYKPMGIADLVDDNTPVRLSNTGPFFRFKPYQTLQDLMRVVVLDYRGWVADPDGYEILRRQPNRLTF